MRNTILTALLAVAGFTANPTPAEHVVEFYQLLGGGLRDAGWMREHMSRNRLAILPNLTHYEIFAAPQLADTVLPFLNAENTVKSWAEQVAE